LKEEQEKEQEKKKTFKKGLQYPSRTRKISVCLKVFLVRGEEFVYFGEILIYLRKMTYFYVFLFAK